jgi:hypothetical protein
LERTLASASVGAEIPVSYRRSLPTPATVLMRTGARSMPWRLALVARPERGVAGWEQEYGPLARNGRETGESFGRVASRHALVLGCPSGPALGSDELLFVTAATKESLHSYDWLPKSR